MTRSTSGERPNGGDLRSKLDEILNAIKATNAEIQAANAEIVGTPEACRRLGIGRHGLDKLVAEGRINRIPHLYGAGGGFMYSTAEIRRFAESGMQSS